jgi:hypothetical protein
MVDNNANRDCWPEVNCSDRDRKWRGRRLRILHQSKPHTKVNKVSAMANHTE